MGILTSIISWCICIFAIVASVAVTVVLWVTYFDVRHNKGVENYSHLEEFIRNETAIYAVAIIATVIMVRHEQNPSKKKKNDFHLNIDFHRFV